MAEQSVAAQALLTAEFDTPVGTLAVVTAPDASGDRPAGPEGPVAASGFRPLAEVLDDLPQQYHGRRAESAELPVVAAAVARFATGDVAAFDSVSVAIAGPEFRVATWRAMREIPAGQVRTYAELAAAAGRPRAARAAGSACATNPVAPFVPCHRVVPTGGGVGNYGFGPQVKAALLAAEGFPDGV